MRGIGRLPAAAAAAAPTAVAKQVVAASSSFSTFPGPGGRGRGRGSGAVSIPDPLTPDSNVEDDDASSTSGHGHGKPVQPRAIYPSFPFWISGGDHSAGRGRGGAPPIDADRSSPLPKKPIFFRRKDDSSPARSEQPSDSPAAAEAERRPPLPQIIAGAIPGSGRGKPLKPLSAPHQTPAQEENRHLKPRSTPRRGASSQRLSREEAVKKAVEILGRGVGRGRGMRGGRFGRGRGFRGRGDRRLIRDGEDELRAGPYLGDNADGERLAQHLGEETMNKLTEAFEEISWRVLPSPLDDAYLDALDTNNMIEYEPEYLMGDFESNPDIDDKPPIPLREALEKMKPFLMAYEGIQSQQEWEDIIEDLMKKLPVFQRLIDDYCGPDRVTAKQQQEELQRVAKTVPDSAPLSVKNFANRAVLTLQSNPGWRWDKKCQFMDKLVWEVGQHYK